MSNTADTNTAAVVDSFFTRFGTGDVPGLIDLHADTFDFVVNGAPNVPWSGRRSTRAELADFFNSFGQVLAPAEVYVITAAVIDGENAVVLGHNKFEVLATGKSFTNDFALHMTVEGRQDHDISHARRQLRDQRRIRELSRSRTNRG